jgi:hypothetical protein
MAVLMMSAETGVEIGNQMTETVKQRVTETRSFHAGWEIREAEDGTVGLRGYAALFDSPAHGEVIRSGAFTKTLADGADVRMLVNHEGVPIARSKSGSLILSTDERGLVVDVPSLDMSNPTVQELVSAMRRGDIDQMSFAFSPVREAFDQSSRTRELLEVRLFDVSVVTYPWYDTTSVGLREVEAALVEARSATTPEDREAALRGLLVALSLMVEKSEDHDEDETDTDEVKSETVEVESTPEVSEESETLRFARREIARALYLR